MWGAESPSYASELVRRTASPSLRSPSSPPPLFLSLSLSTSSSSSWSSSSLSLSTGFFFLNNYLFNLFFWKNNNKKIGRSNLWMRKWLNLKYGLNLGSSLYWITRLPFKKNSCSIQTSNKKASLWDARGTLSDCFVWIWGL